MGLEMPMVYVLAAMEHHGIASSSSAADCNLTANCCALCFPLQEQKLLPLLMGLEMPMVHVLAAMEHHGITFSSKALAQQLPMMCQRLGQLKTQAGQYIKSGDIAKVSTPAASSGCLSAGHHVHYLPGCIPVRAANDM